MTLVVVVVKPVTLTTGTTILLFVRHLATGTTKSVTITTLLKEKIMSTMNKQVNPYYAEDVGLDIWDDQGDIIPHNNWDEWDKWAGWDDFADWAVYFDAPFDERS